MMVTHELIITETQKQNTISILVYTMTITLLMTKLIEHRSAWKIILMLCLLKIITQFTGKTEQHRGTRERYIDAVKMFQILIASKDVRLEPMNYNEDIMKPQFYDKIDTYDTLDYTQQNVKKTSNAASKGTRTRQSVF